ncbi:MAG: HAMP domain-containing sensor histidine kinase [Spirochaetia bacterium]|jgi:signal transduction histidine kinase|nr:HAMP domain-containing sensor histidine kinase [Spirochaetia bacterium]
MWKTKNKPLFHHILLFSIAQFAWLLLLGLWIFWYVTTYIKTDAFTKAAEVISEKNAESVAVLVSGIILLVTLSTILSLIFAYLARQMNITSMYDNFISNVTHELKSPLSSIQLYLETLRKREIERDKKNEFIDTMLSDVERLNKLINSVLYLSTMKYSKIARKLIHDYHIYDADSIIRQTLEKTLKSLKLPEERVTIEGSASCQCVIDKNWLFIVFNNLIDNALKYSINETSIKIKLSRSASYFHIEIHDNGIGIDKKDQRKIFRRFMRLNNPESPNVKGTGIGLFWVKEIIDYHGGKITVSSSGKNLGTSFVISLPVFRTFKNRHINKLLRLSRKLETEKEEEHE